MKRIALFAAVLCVVWSADAGATPLRMDYVLTDLGGGTYRYDFTLTLDNHDLTWLAGNEWDWIVFGDNDFGDTYNGFDPDGSGPSLPDWTTGAFAPPITEIDRSQNAHNGPTLVLLTNGAFLPGWVPVAVGESLTWWGTSSLLIPDGELVWSALVTAGGAAAVDFEVAHQTSVPEPATLALLAIGLAGVRPRLRRRRANRSVSSQPRPPQRH